MQTHRKAAKKIQFYETKKNVCEIVSQSAFTEK